VVRAQIALIVQAKRLLTNYLTKQTEPADLINNLPWLFGGPAQREAQRLARERWARISATSRVARIGCCDDPILAESATNKIGSLGQRAMERNGLDAATKPSNFFVIRSGRKRIGSDQNADQALPRRGRFF
jgi:hypothetical protein